MKKRFFTIAMIAGIATLFLVGGILAGTDVPDVIELNDPGYKKHKKGIVKLSHKKHQTDYAKQYPEFYKNGCGECHHDKDNKPLTELKEGDDVQRCIECHKKPKYITGKKAKGLSKEQKREYQGNALHDNCKGCHKKYNKKMGLKKKAKGYAPNTCLTCHPKRKKK